MGGIAPREAEVEEKIYRFLMNVLEEKKYEIEGVKFDEVEPQFPINGGRADLMLPVHPSKPLLIIECKKMVKAGGGFTAMREFDPLSRIVIDQALMYAVKSGADLFATTNGKVFALFLVPERGEAFRIDRHRLLVREIQLRQDVVEEILTVVARWKAGLEITKTPLDWAFILRLRSFVDYLSQQLVPAVENKLASDATFKKQFDSFSLRIGKASPETYSRESAYIIMNKIVFHKILERYYGKLTKMHPLLETSGFPFASKLGERFAEAMRVTEDFEPVFSTGIYDEVPLPDEQFVLDEINSFIEDMDTYRLEEVGSDVVGFIYESLIPAEERHKLGQFYTPPQIAELISKWAIREQSDKILDPASGSGTFPVKAYGILKDLKPLRGDELHREILNQIYSIDINPFPAHLTAVNLAMRDVRHPTREMNVVVEDFFNVSPAQSLLAPFAIRTAAGEGRRSILLPYFDVVLGNPPYTKWEEMSDETKSAVVQRLGNTIREYGLKAQIRGGLHPSIYMYFILHATNFLNEGGRLGMIISDSWLQSDVGINFGNFLLDSYKVKAVIDFSSRLFPLPLVSTCVLLMEKCADKKGRFENKTVFMRVENETSVDKLLSELSRPPKDDPTINIVRQGDIPHGEKWITLASGSLLVLNTLLSSKLLVKTGELFEAFRGNIEFVSRTSGGVGANAFFYMDDGTVKQWNLEKYVTRLLASPRYTKFFSFDNKDWDALEGSVRYLFQYKHPKEKMPKRVEEYVRWGETSCKTRDNVICSSAKACQARELDRKRYAGWYDLGSIRPVSFFTGYYAQYSRRFVLARSEIALDADFISFKARVPLTLEQIKATLAYLNSSFGQFFVELHGRTTGGGMVSLEKSHASELRIPDVRRLRKNTVSKLASLFDELEKSARVIGGADRRESAEKLADALDRINQEVVDALGLPAHFEKRISKASNLLMERRTRRAEDAAPESISGEDAPRIHPPKKITRQEDALSHPLDKWT